MSANQFGLRQILYPAFAFTMLMFVDSTAYAQMCQRGGGADGGPSSGMMGPSGFNPQAMRMMPGYMPGNGNMMGNGPVAQSQRPSRQALQAKYQAKQERIREKKDAIKAANLQRQKSKSGKSSPAPTA